VRHASARSLAPDAGKISLVLCCLAWLGASVEAWQKRGRRGASTIARLDGEAQGEAQRAFAHQWRYLGDTRGRCCAGFLFGRSGVVCVDAILGQVHGGVAVHGFPFLLCIIHCHQLGGFVQAAETRNAFRSLLGERGLENGRDEGLLQCSAVQCPQTCCATFDRVSKKWCFVRAEPARHARLPASTFYILFVQNLSPACEGSS
jgi:hypothetical protein